MLHWRCLISSTSGPCRALLEVNGLHGLSCKLASGKQLTHASINDIIRRACGHANIPAVNYPTGLSRTDDKHLDDSTLVPWSAGKCVL